MGYGLENNTLALLFEGWTDLSVEGGDDKVAAIRQGLPSTLSSGQLTLAHSFITAENIRQTIESHISAQPDLL